MENGKLAEGKLTGLDPGRKSLVLDVQTGLDLGDHHFKIRPGMREVISVSYVTGKGGRGNSLRSDIGLVVASFLAKSTPS
jgi:hypothetical protein